VPVSGGVRIKVGEQALDFLRPERAAPRFGLGRAPRRSGAMGLDLVVSDLSRCREALARGHVPFEDRGERLLVAPEDACGVAIAMTDRQPAS
jgi:hypothetical protein